MSYALHISTLKIVFSIPIFTVNYASQIVASVLGGLNIIS